MTADTNQVKNLMLASASKSRLARWRDGLHGFADLYQVNNLDLLTDEIVRLKPEVLLLDYELFGQEAVSGVSNLRRLCPETRIVVLTNSPSIEEEWALFKAGVRGCCSEDVEPSSLKALVKAIHQGELWIRRALIHKLLEQLQSNANRNNNVNQSGLSLLSSLTEREYEIAVRVGNGESNKQIAQSLNITDRTVKAHLTEVFRKLGVADRFKVALILSAEKRQARRPPQKTNNKANETPILKSVV